MIFLPENGGTIGTAKIHRALLWKEISSTRSDLLDYLNLVIAEHYPGWERFAGYQVISVEKRLNKTSHYEDNLVFKFT